MPRKAHKGDDQLSLLVTPHIPKPVFEEEGPSAPVAIVDPPRLDARMRNLLVNVVCSGKLSAFMKTIRALDGQRLFLQPLKLCAEARQSNSARFNIRLLSCHMPIWICQMGTMDQLPVGVYR